MNFSIPSVFFSHGMQSSPTGFMNESESRRQVSSLRIRMFCVLSSPVCSPFVCRLLPFPNQQCVLHVIVGSRRGIFSQSFIQQNNGGSCLIFSPGCVIAQAQSPTTELIFSHLPKHALHSVILRCHFVEVQFLLTFLFSGFNVQKGQP